MLQWLNFAISESNWVKKYCLTTASLNNTTDDWQYLSFLIRVRRERRSVSHNTMDGSQDIKEAVEQVVHYIFDHAKLKVRPVNRCSKLICQKTIKYSTLHSVTCIFVLQHLNEWNLVFSITMYHIVILFLLHVQSGATSERAVLMEVLYNFIRLHNKKKQFANSTDLPTLNFETAVFTNSHDSWCVDTISNVFLRNKTVSYTHVF